MEIHFVHPNRPQSDLELFLGPLDGSEIFLPWPRDMQELLVTAKKFSSRGEAQRNGFKGPVPPNFNHMHVGQGANRLDIWIIGEET